MKNYWIDREKEEQPEFAYSTVNTATNGDIQQELMSIFEFYSPLNPISVTMVYNSGETVTYTI